METESEKIHIHIKTNDNKTKKYAIISNPLFFESVDDILLSLSNIVHKENIFTSKTWLEIKNDISKKISEKKKELIVTLSEEVKPTIFLETEFLPKIELKTIKMSIQNLLPALNLKKLLLKNNQIYFVTKNTYFEVNFQEGKNINGDKINEYDHSSIISSDFVLEHENEHIKYKSIKDGYLYLDNTDKLSLYEPIKISQNKMLMQLVFYLPANKDCFKSWFVDYSRVNLCDLTYEQLIKYQKENRFQLVTIKKGKLPENGIPEYIKYQAGLEDLFLHGFIPIQKGQKICEIIPESLPSDGYNIYGEKIKGKQNKSKPLQYYQNIISKKNNFENILFSAIDGVLWHKKNGLHVDDTLLLKHDVDNHTGNIDSQKSVFIKGDIRAGFSVKTTENLFIYGSVENGCKITAKTLFIKGGIFGDSTMIQILKDGELNYLHDATIKCNNDLSIKRYSHNANLYIRGNLTILGSKVNHNHASALMGGICNVVKTIESPSIGGNMSKTQVFIGIDLLLNEHFEEIQKTKEVLLLKIMKLQSLTNTSSVTSDYAELKKLTSQEKNTLKKNLLEIKNWLMLLEKLKEKINLINNQISLIDPKNSKITIHKFIRPDLEIHFGKLTTKVSKELKSLRVVEIQDNRLTNL